MTRISCPRVRLWIAVLAGVCCFVVIKEALAQQAAIELRQTAFIKASNTGSGDQFGNGGAYSGSSVALSADGNTLVVGAPVEGSGATGVNGDQSDESTYGAGAAYVLVRDGGAWRQQAYLKASNPGLTDHFGSVIALSDDGNTLAVSAYFEASAATGINGDESDDSIPQAGAVYVFSRAGEEWVQQAYVKASNTGEVARADEITDGDQFGFSVALNGNGNVLAVSAITEDGGSSGIDGDESDNSAASAGAVYLFTRSSGQWSQESYVKPSNPGGGDLFGYSVSLSSDGNVLAVGAYDEDGSGASTNVVQDDDAFGTGAVYVFERGPETWEQTAYLKASNAERGDSLGVTVDLSADAGTLVATALDEDGMTTGVDSTAVDDQSSDSSTGAVYVFVREDEGWRQQAYLKSSNTGRNDWFGSRFDLSGDGNTLLAGAQLEDSGGQGVDAQQDDDSAQEAGAAYLFTRDGDRWTQRVFIKSSNSEAFDEFGSAVALSRDGRTLAVGARNEDSAATGIDGQQADNSAFDSGAVYLLEW